VAFGAKFVTNISELAVFIVKFSVPPKSLAQFAWAAALFAAALPMHCSAASNVGEVTLTIGQAMSIPADGVPVALQRGSKIHSGDRIETAEGGHVHIRFVDGAMVSVRPTSRLIVEEYQYDARKVAQSSVKFRLEKGVTRAISGAAAEGARERFRLNTPLVAIGVRGTDFVVRTGAEQTVAAVNQGAIVMAPFGDGCAQQGLGPCGSSHAKLLSADMGNVLVEFRNNFAQPELRPFNGVRTSETMLAVAEPRSAAEAGPVRDSKAARGSDDLVTASLVRDVFRQAADVSAAVAVAPPVTTSPVAPAVPVEQAQLAWGRWGAAAFDSTDFSTARAVAREGRVTTVGDNDFILYRMDDGRTGLPQTLGNVSFALDQAHAHFTSATNQIQAATVQGGSLSIDFTSRLFNTSLSLTSVATGNVGLQASGFVREDGLFVSRTANQAVAGVTALDGKSAGYLFEKAAAGGTLSGITLWSR
jgi:hypothetical protein